MSVEGRCAQYWRGNSLRYRLDGIVQNKPNLESVESREMSQELESEDQVFEAERVVVQAVSQSPAAAD